METAVIDNARLEAFSTRAVGDLSSGYAGVMVSLGSRLGLYKAMAGAGPLSAKELALRTGCAERCVREWLNAQAAGGYVGDHALSDTYELSPEQALVLGDEDSPYYIPHAWNVPRLEARITVADVGCGHGHATVLMAQAFPNSRFHGFDTHAPSVAAARGHAAAAGVAWRVAFDVARATDYPGSGYGLICFFDVLHDLGIVVRADALGGDFVAHRLARSRVLLCAAPGYLRQRGRPRHPRELGQHALRVATLPRLPHRFVLTHASGTRAEIAPGHPLLSTANAELCHAGALAGMGIAALPSFAVAAELEQGRLEPALDDWHLFDVDVHACLPSRRQVPAVVRAMLDFLRSEFPGGDRDPWTVHEAGMQPTLQLAA